MADSQRKTAQLYDKSDTTTQYNAYLNANGTWVLDSSSRTVKLRCKGNTTYTISIAESSPIFRISEYSDYDLQAGDSSIILSSIIRGENLSQYTFTTADDSECLIFQGSYALYNSWLNSLMFVEGTTAKPYEPYGWVHSLRKLTTATEAVENPLYSDGTPITSYTIKGNTVQSGTPTPSNPVEVSGVGVRTENLFNTFDIVGQVPSTGNGALVSYNGSTTSFIPINSGNVVVTKPENVLIYLMLYAANGDYIGYDIANAGTTINGSNISGYENARFARLRVDRTTGLDDIQIMLNTGSTAKPFEPYGYKIPISTLQGSAVNYLGSVQTTRQIKKLVLDGTESAYTYTYNNTNGVALRNVLETNYNHVDGLCTHYPVATSNVGDSLWIGAGNANLYFVGILDIMGYTTYNQFMQYLADQYANGTPVTIWYVLATEETGIVNEPLMKIGTNADSISNATSIPTTEGANSITVDTTVQPSEFTATWTGWHNASVQEYDGTNWQ